MEAAPQYLEVAISSSLDISQPGRQVASRFAVDGITCASCVEPIRSALMAMRGVTDVSVSIIDGEVTVKHDDAVAAKEAISSAIADVGFEPRFIEQTITRAAQAATDGSDARSTITVKDAADDTVATNRFAVSGISCASCVEPIRNGLMALTGVLDVSVSVIDGEVTVQHDTAQTTHLTNSHNTTPHYTHPLIHSFTMPPQETTAASAAAVANGSSQAANLRAFVNPYASQEFLSRVSNFSIIESTLREGEQFANAFFDTAKKIEIAKALDAFGVEYIELTSPAASEQSRLDCMAICQLGLKAKILTHVRCHMDDARLAVETGVHGLDVVIGTSSILREFSHGKDIDYIIKQATEVINFIKSKGLEVRFSTEDSFRSDLVDLLTIYKTVDKLGVNRVGIADTVGCASARQVYELVRTLRGVVSCDIECHFHNDTGCSIANAYAALEAGATHIDTSVLGIGERNGITPLGGLVARMYVADPEYIKGKYNLQALRDVENLVAEAVEVQVPFNNYITGYCAFTHKAGIHAKAILNNPSTYEILKPEDFGMTRYVSIGHRLTGWNAVKNRAQQLGLNLTDDQIKEATAEIKRLADIRPQGIEAVDQLLRNYHEEVNPVAA
ncbi:homocitrate synthase [Ramicandelaber brevisporus]|nr:homocitrate synthase [Ramicandelaber brevisporus]